MKEGRKNKVHEGKEEDRKNDEGKVEGKEER